MKNNLNQILISVRLLPVLDNGAFNLNLVNYNFENKKMNEHS